VVSTGNTKGFLQGELQLVVSNGNTKGSSGRIAIVVGGRIATGSSNWKH